MFRLGLLFHTEEPLDLPRRSTAALRLFRRRGERVWEARLLFNRGLVLVGRGQARAGLRDLTAAKMLYEALGAAVAVADTEMAIAEARLLIGDVAGAFRVLDAIGDDLPAFNRTELELSRARALTAAMLIEEARVSYRHALAGMRAGGATDRRLKTSVELARLLSLGDDQEAAVSTALAAAQAFSRRGQPIAAARARTVALGAWVRMGRVPPRAVRVAREDADLLAAAGWSHEARRARLLVARAALFAGALELATEQHRSALTIPGRPPLADRLLLAHVGALLHLARGRPGQAARIAAGGLRMLEQYRLGLGSAELRALASALGSDLAALGLRLALEKRHGVRLFTWSERLRANSLLVRAEVPHDPEILSAQGALRRVERALSEEDGEGDAKERLRSRQAELETRISRRARHLPGAAAAGRQRPAGEVLRALGRRALAQYVELDGRLIVLWVKGGSVRQVDLGPAAASDEPLAWLRFGLRQLARADLGEARRSAALRSVEQALEALDEVLVGPIRDRLGSIDLVLVPGGTLHAVPWAMLPSLRGRPLTVSPSASLWASLEEDRPQRRQGKVVCIAGPSLRHARREVEQVARLHPGSLTLSGRDATAAAALAALDGAAVAHLACHGRFRSDSPLFSSFALADGPVTTFDLQALSGPPRILVLSCCELALSAARPGDELLGLAAVLLGLGTHTIIASVAPVPDGKTPLLMRAFHQRLAAGAEPATALAAAQAVLGARHPELAGFVCLGRG